MNPQLDFDDDLYDLFGTSALSVPDPGVEVITRRAGRRTRRRRAGGAALSCVALLASGLFLANRLQPRSGNIITGTPTTQEPSTTSLPIAAPPGLTGDKEFASVTWPASTVKWERVDSALALGYSEVRHSGETFLAVSTEPGQAATPKQALYASSDGITWAQRASMPAMDLGDVMSANGSLYAVGTSASTAPLKADSSGFGELVVALSSDGAAWNNKALPLDVQSIRAKGANVVNVSTVIERFGNTFVAAASYEVRVPRSGSDLTAKCQKAQEEVRARPGGAPSTVFATLPPPQGAAVVAETSEDALIGSDGALSPTCGFVLNNPGDVPLSTDGLDPIVADLVTHPTRLFVSPNGRDFQPVTLPATRPAGAPLLSLTTDSQGFVLVQQFNDQTAVVSRSTDGETWMQAPDLGGVVHSLGTVGGEVRMLVADTKGRRVYGFAPDGSLRSDGLGGPTTDPWYATFASPDVPQIGGAGFLVKVLPQPPSVQVANPDDFQDEVARQTRILDSVDGITYSQTLVGELIGRDRKIQYISGIIVDKDHYIFTAALLRPDGAPPDTVTFVGRRS